MEILIIDNQDEVSVDHIPLKNLAAYILKKRKVPENIELNVALVSTFEMSRMNKKFRQRKGPTDVLSFKYFEGELKDNSDLIGEIVICPAIAKKQAKQNNTDLASEMKLLLTHGILHLFGYRHSESVEAAEMKKMEIELIKAFDSGA